MILGRGHARYTRFIAKRSGKELNVTQNAAGTIIEAGTPFCWDMAGVSVGDEIEIEVSYMDLMDKAIPGFQTHIDSSLS